jgi:hypothetical protein
VTQVFGQPKVCNEGAAGFASAGAVPGAAGAGAAGGKVATGHSAAVFQPLRE